MGLLDGAKDKLNEVVDTGEIVDKLKEGADVDGIADKLKDNIPGM